MKQQDVEKLTMKLPGEGKRLTLRLPGEGDKLTLQLPDKKSEMGSKNETGENKICQRKSEIETRGSRSVRRSSKTFFNHANFIFLKMHRHSAHSPLKYLKEKQNMDTYRLFRTYCVIQSLRTFSELTPNIMNEPQLGYCVLIELYTRIVSSEVRKILSRLFWTLRESYVNLCE